MFETISLSRRGLLTGAAAVAAAGTLGVAALPARALAPMPDDQAPYLYRFKLGDAQATIVSDGILPLGDPAANFTNITKEEIQRQLRDNFLPLDKMVLQQNVLVLNAGGKTIVFDTGLGNLHLFGPTTGKLMQTLAGAGIDPKGVDAVVLSHGHPDHLGGIMADEKTSHFPNAQIFITQADHEFWTDLKKVGEPSKVFWETAVKNLGPNRDRITFITDGQEFLPGIQALYAPGHTVGHTIFMISSGGQQLCYIGDLTHHPVLLMEKPLTQFKYDTDPVQSAQSRVKMLTMLADNRIPILAYHFAWPGLGNVAKAGDGFRYYPAPIMLQ
ncbi:MAG: MBL fold metallo-hydrolase [Alphaproteobacteria bacterium]|nr:MBL fold metallo-hydrolase [Alphaproteobacteria bacterium]